MHLSLNETKSSVSHVPASKHIDTGTSKARKDWSAVSVLAEHPKDLFPKLPLPLRSDRLILLLPAVECLLPEGQHPLGGVDAQHSAESAEATDQCWARDARQNFVLYVGLHGWTGRFFGLSPDWSWKNVLVCPFCYVSEVAKCTLRKVFIFILGILHF